jgi:dipeptidase D
VESIIWTSSAGSRDIQANLKLSKVNYPENCQSYDLIITGLRGGHSGINIQDNRVNAIKLSANIVDQFQNITDLYIGSINGGNAKNAIPRYCKTQLCLSNFENNLLSEFQNIIDFYLKNYISSEPDLKITLQASDQIDTVFDLSSTNKIIKLVNSIHSGIYQMSADIPNLVQTSANLGTINTHNETIEFLFMVRSNDTLELKIATNQIIRQFELTLDKNLKFDITNLNEIKATHQDLEIRLPKSLSAWKHDPNNPLIEMLIDSHQSILGFAPKIEAVHAGLECGVLKSYLPNCHIISFGPTIENAHSPAESVNIKSVESCFKLLKLVITKLSDQI